MSPWPPYETGKTLSWSPTSSLPSSSLPVKYPRPSPKTMSPSELPTQVWSITTFLFCWFDLFTNVYYIRIMIIDQWPSICLPGCQTQQFLQIKDKIRKSVPTVYTCFQGFLESVVWRVAICLLQIQPMMACRSQKNRRFGLKEIILFTIRKRQCRKYVFGPSKLFW